MTTTYTLHLHPLTALHIGTGRSVEPHEYTIIPKNDTPLYLRINFETIFEGMDEKLKNLLLRVLSEQADFVRFRSILQKNPKIFEQNYVYGCHVTEEFHGLFNDKKNDPNNQLAVLECYRPPYSKAAYIPGSSVKGAIRTALLNKHTRRSSVINRNAIEREAKAVKKFDTKFQQKVFNYQDEKEDPFRFLRITDGKVMGKRQMLVGCAYNYSLKSGKPRDSDIPMYLETVRGELLEGDAAVEVELTLDEDGAKALGQYRLRNDTQWNKGKPLVFTVAEICEAANTFYKKAWAFEYSKYQNNPATNKFVPWEELDKRIQAIGKDHIHEFLLRIGRFSHAEAVTIEDYRRLPKGYGKSRTLFSYINSRYPMGWVVARLEEKYHA